ncbi:MAG: hypothetical protein QG567_364 [Campylobacterota bacterium]|nr:hypothetical protein [Campylobacterota bacterium]
MHNRFEGFELEANHGYTLNISKKEIVRSDKIKKEYEIKTYSAPSRLMQIAAIKKALFDLLKKPHILPQKTALILPDEEFAELLSFYDYKKNFNYAMGFSFYNEPLYKKLKAIYELREEKNHENLLRAKRLSIDEKLLEELWEKVIDFDEIVRIFETFGEEIDDKEKRHLYLENIHALKKIKKELASYPLKEIFHLFLNRLTTIKIDMTGGGNITVMGALESRGVEFDAVVVCDFNEGFVPKENKKDLYLNSAVRKHSNLPTRKDRQNLQLDLYHNLFLRSKEAAIIYVKSEDSIPSSFLKQLQIEKEPIEIGYEYAPLLYENNTKCEQEKSLIEIEVDLANEPLSATKLKDYLTCKRKFYYKYLERIKEHKIPSDQFEPYQMGNFLHSVFRDIFRKKTAFSSEKELFNEIEMELKKLIKDDIALQFEGDIWLKKLLPFVQNEIKRFKEGYEVFLCEKKLECAFEGMLIEGVIDRIDKKEDRLFIIDYKSGSYPVSLDGKLENTKDFQLVFYEILASNFGKIGGAFYYDLNNSIMIKEEFFSQKKALLQTHIEKYKEKTQTFEMTDEIKECRYCPYKIICERE